MPSGITTHTERECNMGTYEITRYAYPEMYYSPVTLAEAIKRIVIGEAGADRRWKQTRWCETQNQPTTIAKAICNTTHCVAGWAAVMSPGYVQEVKTWTPSEFERRMAHKVQVRFTEMVIGPEGQESMQSVGQRVLGLDDREQDYLFDGARTYEEVIAALDQIIAGESVMPLDKFVVVVPERGEVRYTVRAASAADAIVKAREGRENADILPTGFEQPEVQWGSAYATYTTDDDDE